MSGRGASGAMSVIIGGFLMLVAFRFETGLPTIAAASCFIALGAFLFWRAARTGKR